MFKTDVLIVGGGIIGVSAAYFLSKKGVDVTLIERHEIGREASGATAGTMAIQNKNINLVPLVIESLKLWQDLQMELKDDIGYREPGGLRVAEDPQQRKSLLESVKKFKQYHVNIDVLHGKDLKSLAPYLGESVLAAGYCDRDAKSNPLVASTAIAKAAKQRGAKIVDQESVIDIKVVKTNSFTVQTQKNTYRTKCLLNAAGVWSRDIFKMLDIDVPVSVDPMQVMVTEQVGKLFPYVITHVCGNLTLKQVETGNVVIGGGWKAVGDPKENVKRINFVSMTGNVRGACRVIPALKNLNLIRCWAGLEGRSPDQLPLLGEVKMIPGFFSASCAKGGYTLGPVLGKLASEIIMNEKPFFHINEFDVNRLL